MNTSPLRPSARTCRANTCSKPYVVADRGQRRSVGGEREGGQRGAVATRRPTNSAAMCWASAALPPLPASITLPPLLSEAAIRSAMATTAAINFSSAEARSTTCCERQQVSDDGFVARIGHGLW